MEQTVIITGGANGLGKELVRVFIENGWYVCNVDNDAGGLTALDAQYDGKAYKGFLGDVSDEKTVSNIVDCITAERNIDALINNAGSPSFKSPADYNAADVELCLQGLKGMIFFSSRCLRYMEKTGGRIVNVMSSAALRGNAQESVYCAVKWGERGYTESLKAAYGGKGIRIHGVYPGGINTDFYKNSRHYVSKEKQNTFMSANELADIMFENIFAPHGLIVEDLVINRIKN